MRTTQIIALLLTLPSSVTAQIWRVDNNPNRSADFRTIQGAVDAAQTGDTIYVAGSTTSYGDVQVRKPVVMIGTGYFLDENPELAIPLSHARVNRIAFYQPNRQQGELGARRAVLTGFEISRIDVFDSVEISRNKINYINVSSTSFISQNYILLSVTIASSQALQNQGVTLEGLAVTNNIVGIRNANTAHSIHASSGSTEVLIANNTVESGLIFAEAAVIQHNILKGGTIQGDSRTSILYNMSSQDIGTENGNQSNVNMAGVFVGGDSPDGQYQLAANSLARGAGLGEEDLGAFGGAEPYVISGLPPVPFIYDLTVGGSGSANTGLPVRFRVRAVR